MTSKPQFRRVASIFAIVSLVASTFSGCLRATAEFSVSKDNTISGSIIVAVSDKTIDSLVQQSAQGPDQVKSWIQEETTLAFEPIAPGSSAQSYSQDGFTGTKLTFQNVNIKDFGASDGVVALELTHTSGQFKLKGQAEIPEIEDFLGGLAQQIDFDQAGSQISLTFNFPGPVTATNGAASGSSVTWLFEFGQTTQINAIAKDSEFPLLLVCVIAGGGVLLVALIVLLIVLLRHRSKQSKQQPFPALASWPASPGFQTVSPPHEMPGYSPIPYLAPPSSPSPQDSYHQPPPAGYYQDQSTSDG